jgi:hypothetical protein
MKIFTKALESANGTNFKKVNQVGRARQEPRRPWWNENCANLLKVGTVKIQGNHPSQQGQGLNGTKQWH